MKEHVEAHFNHFRRGKSHTTPKWEDDVVNLQKAYHNGDAHVHNLSRLPTCKATTSVPDFINIGSSPERLRGLISRWSIRRLSDTSIEEEFGENAVLSIEEELTQMFDGLQIDS